MTEVESPMPPEPAPLLRDLIEAIPGVGIRRTLSRTRLGRRRRLYRSDLRGFVYGARNQAIAV